MKGLQNLGALLDKVAITPDPKPKIVTPVPMRTKVISRASRVPINRQAALIVAKPPWWGKLQEDLFNPAKPPPVVTVEQLKEAYRQNALLAERIAKYRSSHQELTREVELLKSRLAVTQGKLETAKLETAKFQLEIKELIA